LRLWLVVAFALAVAVVIAGCGRDGVRVRHVRGTVAVLSTHQRERGLVDQVAFADDRRGLMTTSLGDVLRSDDGGVTWTRVRGGVRLADLQAPSPRVAIGLPAGCRRRCRVLRTVDRGAHWHRVAVLPSGDLSVVSADRWFVAGSYTLFVTTDGGRAWARRSAPCRGASWFAVSFFSASNGYAVCGDEPGAGNQGKHLRRTVDGGRTWRTVRARPPEYGSVLRLRFRDARNGLLSTVRGGIYATRDGGAHWSEGITSAQELQVGSISLPAGHRAFATLDGIGLFRAEATTRGGSRVFPRSDPQPDGPLSFATRSDGIAIDSNLFSVDGAPVAVETTADGGRSWARRTVLPRIGDVSQLERTGPQTVWAVAWVASTSVQQLKRSDDDGMTWRTVFTADAREQLSVTFVSSRVGFLSTGSELRRTMDGGAHWTRTATARINLAEGRFVSTRVGWASDDQSRLVHTTDAGRTWTRVPLPVRQKITTSAIADARHWLLIDGDCVGPSRRDESCPGKALRTQDGGRSWDVIKLDHVLEGSINVVNADLLFASDSGLLRSTDGGQTWQLVPPLNEVHDP
jgi:photosystem II stability/assembly factor-like uncharacterized protein